ncbi:MAG: hypothetical protein KDA60_06980 [Planctomycetales bacterium]|nr:hypothetical protein [Planctomycetales bacterium]
MDTVLELHEAITATQSKGIEFVGESTVEEAIHDATCQVCGDGIHQNAVLCRRCHTPHHQECWEYYGACSTYGCRETQYRIPHNRNAPRNPEIIAKPVIRSPEEIRQREEDKRKKGDRYRRREGRRRGRQ